jgi:hypothetical protein
MTSLLHREQVLELSPELMSLAFHVLALPKPPEFQIPEVLEHLQQEDWLELAQLLLWLEKERDLSPVH